ncbi:hypothetical protein [Terasakiella sp. SH-1]|uniref:hypothetical protein n=1 Tax=Terasakiella sp. SH-1 TaxID=2560057 RepID=UPI00107403C1|nr:hypothetical protein [Terasakiella sp. SH-1]
MMKFLFCLSVSVFALLSNVVLAGQTNHSHSPSDKLQLIPYTSHYIDPCTIRFVEVHEASKEPGANFYQLDNVPHIVNIVTTDPVLGRLDIPIKAKTGSEAQNIAQRASQLRNMAKCQKK